METGVDTMIVNAFFWNYQQIIAENSSSSPTSFACPLDPSLVGVREGKGNRRDVPMDNRVTLNTKTFSPLLVPSVKSIKSTPLYLHNDSPPCAIISSDITLSRNISWRILEGDGTRSLCTLLRHCVVSVG